jgi:C1A family cysteine protease
VNKKLINILAIIAGILLVFPTAQVAGQTAPPTWTVVPTNPAYLSFIKAMKHGDTTPIMPSALDLSKRTILRGPVRAQIPANIGSIPSSYDLRTVGKVTWTPWDSCGACWANSTMDALESVLAPTEMWAFSRDHLQMNTGLTNMSCGDGGNPYLSANYLAAWRGPVKGSDFSYEGSALQKPKVQKHVQKILFVPQRQDPLDNDWIKLMVMFFGGVYSNAHASGWGYDADFNTLYSSTYTSGHSVCIIGWDDNFDKSKFTDRNPSATMTHPPGNGAFLVRDPHAPLGYQYISYYDAAIAQDVTVFTAESPGNYNRIYQYDPFGMTFWMYLLGSNALGGRTGAANVFASETNDCLAAVGFFHFDTEAAIYEISIYLDPPAGSPINNQSGPAAVVTATVPFPGYYTVKLPKKVPLAVGQKFSAVLVGHDASSDFGVLLPIEKPIQGYSSITAKPGQSYVSGDGVTWQDLTQLTSVDAAFAQSNVCVKAFTVPRVAIIGASDPQALLNRQLTWKLINYGNTTIQVKPVAQPYKLAKTGLKKTGAIMKGFNYVDVRGVPQKISKGWLQIAPGQTVTVYSNPGLPGNAAQVAFNAYTLNSKKKPVLLSDVWKYAPIPKSYLHVVSTSPGSNQNVNSPGLNMISVTFDQNIKPGPGFQEISVTSASESKFTYNSVSGNQLTIITSSPLESPGIGGTLWTVRIPENAVTDQSGNPLEASYSWSFSVIGAN